VRIVEETVNKGRRAQTRAAPLIEMLPQHKRPRSSSKFSRASIRIEVPTVHEECSALMNECVPRSEILAYKVLKSPKSGSKGFGLPVSKSRGRIEMKSPKFYSFNFDLWPKLRVPVVFTCRKSKP
jgi:hypothetical protein